MLVVGILGVTAFGTTNAGGVCADKSNGVDSFIGLRKLSGINSFSNRYEPSNEGGCSDGIALIGSCRLF